MCAEFLTNLGSFGIEAALTDFLQTYFEISTADYFVSYPSDPDIEYEELTDSENDEE